MRAGSPGGDGSGSPLRTRLGAPLAALLVALAPFAFHWRLFAPGAQRRWFEDGDFVDQFFAFATFETAELAAGRLPLWNPHAFAGAPFWADVQAAVAYPPSLAVVLASAWLHGGLRLGTFQLEAVAHLALGALFMFALARRLIGGSFGPAVAALAWSLGGYLTGYPMLQLAVLESIVWLPLALLGADAALARRRSWLLLPLALGMAVLAGHPQTALHIGYAVTAFTAWRAWPFGGDGAARRRALSRALPRLGAAAVLGAGLSAAGWWPALEFLALSNRASADHAALAYGFPPRELLGLVLAGLTKWSPLYVGVLPLLLAGWAGARALRTMRGAAREGPGASPSAAAGDERAQDDAREAWDGGPAAQARDDRFWLALGGTALLLSLGAAGPLFDAFYLLAPGFDLFRGQERAAALVAFSLAMLAGRAAASWLRAPDGAAIDRAVGRGAAGLAVLALGLALVADGGARDAMLRLVFASGAAVLVAALRPRAARAGRMIAWMAFAGLVVALDLYSAGARANVAYHPPSELSGGPVAAVLSMTVDRVHDDHRLPPNAGMLHGYASTHGASPLRLRTYDALVEGLAGDEQRRWDLLGVSHVVTWRRDLPGARLILDDGDAEHYTALFARDAVRPPAWRVGRAEPAADDAAALARLADPAFDPFGTVLLHDGQAASPGPSAASAQVLARGPGEIEVLTDGALPGWLVVSELAYPAWRATIDGAPTPILRADVALMAVAVPAGPHAVRLWVAPGRVASGLAASLVAALAMAGVAARGVWPTRRAANIAG